VGQLGWLQQCTISPKHIVEILFKKAGILMDLHNLLFGVDYVFYSLENTYSTRSTCLATEYLFNTCLVGLECAQTLMVAK